MCLLTCERVGANSVWNNTWLRGFAATLSTKRLAGAALRDDYEESIKFTLDLKLRVNITRYPNINNCPPTKLR